MKLANRLRSSKAEAKIYQKFRDLDVNKVGLQTVMLPVLMSQDPSPPQSQDHMIDREEFRAAMGQRLGEGHFNLDDRDIELLEKKFYGPGVEEINYMDFMNVIRQYSDKVIRR